jgi:hypothetical protein
VHATSESDTITQQDSIEEDNYDKKVRRMAETIKQSSKTNRVTKEIDIGKSIIAKPNIYQSTYLGNSMK